MFFISRGTRCYEEGAAGYVRPSVTMCGIFCLLSLSPAHFDSDRTVHEHLRRRGPNSSQDVTVTGRNPWYRCGLSAHVLHMRGLLTPQPVQDDGANVLLWNGEVFGGLLVKPEENDTRVVSRCLSSCSGPSDFLSVLSRIRGPWAFVYYQKAGDFLWFGRDYFGRRSLLWKSDAGGLTLTSVAAHTSGSDPSVWQEVPAVGVFRIDLKAAAECGSATLELFPWAQTGSDGTSACIETVSESVSLTTVMNESGLTLASPVAPLNVSIPESPSEAGVPPDPRPSVEHLQQLLASRERSDEAKRLIDVVSEAVRRRVQAPPRYSQDRPEDEHASVAVLFSGGIDSMVLAALADRHIPAQQPIDLLNVAFKLQEPKKQNESAKKKHKNKASDAAKERAAPRTSGPFDVPDRITGKAGLRELQDLNPERKWNFVEINVTQEELQKMRRERICHLVHPLETVLDDSIGCAVWFAARGAGFVTEDGDQAAFTSSAKVGHHRHLAAPG